MNDNMIEMEQERAEALFEQLPTEQQAAILEREAVIVAVIPDGRTRRVNLAVSSLRLEGATSAVNDLVQAVFKRNRGR